MTDTTQSHPARRTFTVAQLEELDVGPWSAVANYEGNAHRWYTVRHLVFEHEGAHWMVDYLDPASEGQEDQGRWVDASSHDETIEVPAVQVHQVPRIVEHWEPVDQIQDVDPAEVWLIDVIEDQFADLDDSEDPPFGCYPVSDKITGAAIRVSPDQDAEHWEDKLIDGEAPTEPVVLVVAQRVKR